MYTCTCSEALSQLRIAVTDAMGADRVVDVSSAWSHIFNRLASPAGSPLENSMELLSDLEHFMEAGDAKEKYVVTRTALSNMHLSSVCS